ncbi:hypothetical protein C0992_003229 [Termitomyces sp. T32_za158]|nr:hypothetical protein C0992_003229 [Termitomyces sp. T32_za158]
MQNQRAYQKRKSLITAASNVPASLQLPNLPGKLYKMADFPLPTSTVFQISFRNCDWYEDSDWADSTLANWNSPPPYASLPSGNADQFYDVLLGYRLRKRKEEEVARLDQYKDNPLCNFATKVHTELIDCHAEWEELDLITEGMQMDPGRELGVQLLEWKARRVCHLEQDFLSLQQGFDALLRLFVDCWTPIK